MTHRLYYTLLLFLVATPVARAVDDFAPLDAIVAEAIGSVFEEYVDKHGLDDIADIFAKGVKIEVGDMLLCVSKIRDQIY